MARPGRELLHLTAPVAIAPQEKDSDTVVVKGFASVERVESDRSGDVVPPDEFQIDKFMVSPCLLVNHKFWLDDKGNGVAVGRPTEMHAVKIADIGDEKNWGVVDLKTKEQVNTFPKAQVPELKKNDRGLFVVADVTVDEVAKMVNSGELSTFSWRGLVTVAYRVNDQGRTERVLTDIDLYEVSLTHIPDQTSAQAVVVKSADGVDRKLPLSVYAVRLEKSKYESKEIAEAYFKTHNLQCDAVKDENGSFYGFQRAQSDFDANQLVTVKMADGVHVIAGPLKPEADSFAWVTESLGSGEVEKLASLNTDTKDVTMSEEKVEVQTDEKEEVLKEAEALDSFGDSLAEKTAAGVATALTPAFESLTKTLEAMGTNMTSLVEKAAGNGGAGGGGGAGADDEEDEEGKEEAAQGAGYKKKAAKKAEEDKDAEEEEKAAVKKAAKDEKEKDTDKEDVGKSAGFDDVMGVLNALAQNLQQTQEQVVEVAKTAEGLSKATPAVTDRDERLDIEKAAEGQDPNSIFDSTFPFLGGIS